MTKTHTDKKKNGYVFKICCAAAALFAGLAAGMASQQTQSDLPAIGKVVGTGCPGTYYALARMTNSSGALWLTPPAGTTNGIFKDISGFPAHYTSTVEVVRHSDLNAWCSASTNGVSFPASSSTTYTMVVYVTSKNPPPTNGQPLILQVTWQ